MACTFSVIGKNRIDEIQGLWEKLNELHLHDATHFKNHYRAFTFGQRCEKFTRFPDDDIRIEIIREENVCVGYCISTVETNSGEIDSLFIEPRYRNDGLGSKLVHHSLDWLNGKKCREITVAVAEGHEAVFAFYRKFDFYPRMTCLQLKR